jgi:hypothetical protein
MNPAEEAAEKEEFERKVAEAKALGDPLCFNCFDPESKHVYSGPSYSSDDGQPIIFEGCYGQGSIQHNYGSGPDDAFYSPACDCHEFVEEDDVDDNQLVGDLQDDERLSGYADREDLLRQYITPDPRMIPREDEG